jgi:hypothetical protein
MIFTGAARRTRTVSGSLGRWNPATRSRRRLCRDSSGPGDRSHRLGPIAWLSSWRSRKSGSAARRAGLPLRKAPGSPPGGSDLPLHRLPEKARKACGPPREPAWQERRAPDAPKPRLRNTDRARCSQGGYVPAAELEQEVEALYQGVRVPAALRHQLERVLRVEVAERERHRAEAESRLATDGEKLEQAKQIIDLALDLAKDCATSYHKAGPDVRKMWNRAFFQTIRVRDGAIADFTYEEPFGSLLGSHKGSMVELRGLEPRTCCLQSSRSTT